MYEYIIYFSVSPIGKYKYCCWLYSTPELYTLVLKIVVLDVGGQFIYDLLQKF